MDGKMKKILAVLLLSALPVMAQSNSVYNATTYAYTTQVTSANAATGSSSIGAQPTAFAQGIPFSPYNTNASVTINRNGANAETVTPTAVANCFPNSVTCTLSASFSSLHVGGESIQSGTFGLQEAINVATAAGSGTVLIDASWKGPAGPSLITAATGSNNIPIQDNRNPAGPIFYQWNGSVYVAQSSGAASFVAGSQVMYLPYKQATTSATTLTDYSGNGLTGTFDTSTHAPTWTANGYGILFRSAQDISIPAAVLSGAKTIQMWFSLTSPGLADSLGFNFLLTDGNANGICYYPSWNGQITLGSTGSCGRAQGLDRYVGPTGIAFTMATSTTDLQYINGTAVKGYDFGTGGVTLPWNSASAGMIGNYVPNISYGANMIFYGMVVYNTVLTPAQIAANDLAFKSAMQAATGFTFGPTYLPSAFYLINGDSRYVNVGAGRALVSDIPAISLKNLGVDNWVNYSVFGYQQVALNANIANVEYAVLDGYGNGPKVVWNEAGINDIENSATAATVLTSLQSYCSNLHTRYPGIKVMVNTLAPDSNSTTAQETQRETLNTNLVNAWVGGTLGCDGLADEDGDPLAATQVTPNRYLPTGTSAFNSTYYLDGIHYTAVLDNEMANGDSCALADLVGRLNQPCWITRQIPFKVLGIFANTSQVVNLVQLGPGWQVCGVKENVSVAFAGTSITGLTATVGDSTGTATQYLASQSLLATGGPAPNMNPNYLSTHGIVQATFASVGANMSALTAGAMNIDVCVVNIP